MKRTLRKKSVAFGLAIALAVGVTGTAYAATFGNNLNGASSVEVLQVKYDGAAWNYPGSVYRYAWFKYHRNGRTLMQKYAYNGKVTGSVWDNLFDWHESQTTEFNWGRG